MISRVKEDPSKRFLEFKNNINKIWKKTIRNGYKLLFRKTSRLNKPSNITI
jgi:hypothetical protein